MKTLCEMFSTLLKMKFKFSVAFILSSASALNLNPTRTGKEKCWLLAFSLFPTMLSKSFLYWVVKSFDCLVRVKIGDIEIL